MWVIVDSDGTPVTGYGKYRDGTVSVRRDWYQRSDDEKYKHCKTWKSENGAERAYEKMQLDPYKYKIIEVAG